MKKHKVGGVIVSHGRLATELLAAAETVIGDLDKVAAVSIGWHDDVEAAKDEIQRAINEVSQGEGVLLMTDMFGGTPTNISAMFLEEGSVEIVTGVNLPMVVKFATHSDEIALSELAREVEEQGKQSIYRTSALLEPSKMKKDA
ncbi:MAG: PTS sugar transporter subunit IIA [Pyrinomonadaceae bacterium]